MSSWSIEHDKFGIGRSLGSDAATVPGANGIDNLVVRLG